METDFDRKTLSVTIFLKKRDNEVHDPKKKVHDATWKKIQNEINKVQNQELPEVVEVQSIQINKYFEVLTSLTGDVKLGQLV